MTDIAERLRNCVKQRYDIADDLALEAAGEIERLEAALNDECAAHRVCVEMRDTANAEIERLRAALKECSDDLADYLDHHYAKTIDHPAMKVRYDRDMTPVLEARRLLANEQ